MEELLKQLLEGQKQLFEGQKELFEGQKQLFEGQKELFAGQKQLFEGQQQLFEGQQQLFAGQKHIFNRLDTLDNELAAVKTEVATIKADMATKTQQDENSQFIGALLHRTEELNALVTNLGLTSAKLEGMLVNTTTKEDSAELFAQLQVVNERIFRQETEIKKLKAS